MLLFESFPKIPRLKKEVVVTEKIDGTNAQVAIFELDTDDVYNWAKHDPFCLSVIPSKSSGSSPLAVYAGSRTRWIAPGKQDNFGFAAWVLEHVAELSELGLGRHFGEWYGKGIQRGYELDHRRFALFNTARWLLDPSRPACCSVVPLLARGEGVDLDAVMQDLQHGSRAVPGFQTPEGIVIYHTASRQLYKRTFEQDGGKWAL